MSTAESALPDDLVVEILLRLPPDEPQWLVCASVVCKPWRLLLSGPAFLNRHRAHRERHRTPPPMLGLILDMVDEDVRAASFLPVTAFRPSELDHHRWRMLDCRHGRALLFDLNSLERLLIWDPMTGEKQQLPTPDIPRMYFGGAVLCATPGCVDHLGCRGGPFLVAFVGTDFQRAHACLYSSETGAWSAATSQARDSRLFIDRSFVMDNKVYFFRDLSMLFRPSGYYHGIALFPAVDGTLGFAGLRNKHELSLWSLETTMTTIGADDDGVIEGWTPRRVINLETMTMTMLLIGEPAAGYAPYEIAFADSRIVLLCTDDAVLMVELELGNKVTKVLEKEHKGPIFPYMSFFSPVRSRGGAAAATDQGAAAPVCLIPVCLQQRHG